ncbi:divalent metal cation transporter [Rubrobacter marinus]|uniref:divalent metal cation transporter n=1 Tax=Rubrobacter marinus TaxID=2653852 RepID=UPI002B1BD5FF|nr:divalent metal cation transporter [Rubrobacter marinus]
MAMLIQSMSAKLGIATGKNLPRCAASGSQARFARLVGAGGDHRYGHGPCGVYRAALALNLLFGIPLLPAGLITAVAAFGILELQRRGFRPLEAAISALLAVIVVSFAFQMFYAQPRGPHPGGVVHAPVRRYGKRAAR